MSFALTHTHYQASNLGPHAYLEFVGIRATSFKTPLLSVGVSVCPQL